MEEMVNWNIELSLEIMQEFAFNNWGNYLCLNQLALHQDQRVRSRLPRVDSHPMPAKNVDNCFPSHLAAA